MCTDRSNPNHTSHPAMLAASTHWQAAVSAAPHSIYPMSVSVLQLASDALDTLVLRVEALRLCHLQHGRTLGSVHLQAYMGTQPACSTTVSTNCSQEQLATAGNQQRLQTGHMGAPYLCFLHATAAQHASLFSSTNPSFVHARMAGGSAWPPRVSHPP